ncbi:hypothetical protein [Spirosoma radiotolerans]|uniref:hypothetical protein n=1 Tax=Spirosoma radiotolerans TaxID=1379870 RepID=UPI000A9461C3|nr:hypothetical protein [Spirosoma radiotolerans]
MNFKAGDPVVVKKSGMKLVVSRVDVSINTVFCIVNKNGKSTEVGFSPESLEKGITIDPVEPED